MREPRGIIGVVAHAGPASEKDRDLSTSLPKPWRLLPHDPAAIERLASALRLAPITAQLLLNRGLTAPDDARRFLDAPLTGLHAPELLPGASEAAARIFEAVRQGRRICVYGDYDVDGVSGAALLLQCLRLLGAQADLYVPRRLDEGYGLNRDALGQIAATGVSLVVTVDCGIASVAEAEEAKRLGLELIVTDHHEYKETLPDAAVLVHPRLPGGAYPFGGLSGSAVALKLAWALAQKASGGPKVTPRYKEFLLDAVALASLGVVADVVPLLDENRILVRYGLHRLREAPPLGAAGAVPGGGHRGRRRAAGLRRGLSHRPAAERGRPARLRPAGGGPADDDAAGAGDRSGPLSGGAERAAPAAGAAHDDGGPAPGRGAGAAGRPGPGAGQRRLARRRHRHRGRPAGRVLTHGRRWSSSCRRRGRTARRPAWPSARAGRSPASRCTRRSRNAATCCWATAATPPRPASACGRSISTPSATAFVHVTAARRPEGPRPAELILDAEAPLSALTFGLLRDLDRLEPYGAGNRRPLFLAGGLQVEGEPRKVGGGERHLMFRVRQNGTVLKAIAFGMADRVEELMSAGGACCLACTPKLNEWQGRRSVDLEVTDFQAGPEARLT